MHDWIHSTMWQLANNVWLFQHTSVLSVCDNDKHLVTELLVYFVCSNSNDATANQPVSG